MMPDNQHRSIKVSPQVAFLLVSLSLGQLGDGLNIFQGIYLVGRGWNEGSVGLALSLMGLTALIIQPWAGDWVDKTTVDRRILLAGSCLMTALSASSILLVHKGNTDHMLIFSTKILEGAMSSFLGPCLAALTLACFGPNDFDAVMASNILWGHVGSVAAAVLAGIVSYILYPDVEYCFLVIGASALIACFFLQYLPQGDPLMGRGFATKESPSMKIEVEQDTGGTYGFIKPIESDETTLDLDLVLAEADSMNVLLPKNNKEDESPTAASYWEIFTDTKSVILCLTGFFFHFANANVLLVLGEMMGHEQGGTGRQRQLAIPLVAGAIVTAQMTMAVATYAGDKLTLLGVGRKPLFLAALISLPIRCALIIFLKDAGDAALLSTQVLDGISGGLIGLVQPYLVADITFGTGRFNVLMGVTASCFGLGATLSNYLGQMVAEKFDHDTSLMASFFIAIVPIILFLWMPETLGTRAHRSNKKVTNGGSDTSILHSVSSGSSSMYGSFDC